MPASHPSATRIKGTGNVRYMAQLSAWEPGSGHLDVMPRARRNVHSRLDTMPNIRGRASSSTLNLVHPFSRSGRMHSVKTA